MRGTRHSVWLAGAAAILSAACGTPDNGADADAGDAADVPADVPVEEFFWDAPPNADAVDGRVYNPWLVPPSSEIPVPRDWQLRRGIVHIHSPYSHDACDNEPFIDGVRNEECFNQLREGLCATRQDFAFLSDHATLFADYEFPEVLLYADGDTLIERGGLPVANRIPCPDGHDVIIAAGTETGTMPLGLEHHVGDTPEARHTAYDDASVAGVEALKAAGAMSFVYHTEEWEPATLIELPLDGVEIYNMHANLMHSLDTVVLLISDLSRRPWRVPVPELGIAALFSESEEDLYRWSLLVAVRRTTGVLATDVHRNTFNAESLDGERIDSYRRLTHWFANYVLLPAGDVDDLALKDAIRHGRLYGCFDYLGYAIGFDFHAEAGASTYEMGDEVPGGAAATLRLALPEVYRLDPTGPQPAIRGRILRANDGAWDEVAAGTDDLQYAASPGVYRAEVRIVPEHLRTWLGSQADLYVVERVWIYSNPIYVDVTWPAPPGTP